MKIQSCKEYASEDDYTNYQRSPLADTYPVTRISGTEADGQVIVLTAEFGPVHVKRVGETWRVDASEIIRIRMWNKRYAPHPEAEENE